MSDALIITVVATGIVAVIVGAVTWMLVLPARRAPQALRVLAVGEPPLARALLLAERPAEEAGDAPACGEIPELEAARLHQEFHRCEDAADAPLGSDPTTGAMSGAQASEENGEAEARAQATAERARRLAQVLIRLARPGGGGPAGAGVDEIDPAATRESEPGPGPGPGLEPGLEPELAVRQAATRPATAPPGYHRLDDERWYAELVSPELEPSLTGLMALLGPEVVTWHAYPAERYGLTREERVESLTSPPRIAELSPDVARAVGVNPPVLFVTPDREARLMHINLAVAGRYQAALAVGAQALAFEDEARMRFMLGRKLTFMRAEHLVCTCVDGTEDLRALHLATAHVLDPGTLAEPPDQVAGLSREEALQRLREHFGQAERAGAARRLLRAALESAPSPQDAAAEARWEHWQVASAETSFRCGLLLSGDLEAALSILDQDDLTPGTDRGHRQCYPVLYRFYLSEEYEALRQALAGDTQA
jgi:hypothetical protein